jgi:hypothetical protein
MKRIPFLCFAVLTIVAFADLYSPTENTISVETKNLKLPDWQWTSGPVEMKKTAAKQCFVITFNPKVYRPRDSVKITFSTYKVTMGNLNKTVNLDQCKGRINFVYYINANWIPLVVDTNDRINQPFYGKKNIGSDSIKNYSILTTVPLSRTYTLSASAVSFLINNVFALPKQLDDPAIGPTLAVSIKGIEIKKLEPQQ